MSQPLDVLIVGAGLAGLSAAIALGKQGHRVVVAFISSKRQPFFVYLMIIIVTKILERSSFLKETGAAIHLAPNCTILLEWMGIDPLDFESVPLNEIRRYDTTGNLIFQKGLADIRHTWQAEWYMVHRVDLQNALKERVSDFATLHTGCKIIDIDIQTSRPVVTLDDGRSFDADLLLGADGLRVHDHRLLHFESNKMTFTWSQVHGKITPSASPPYRVGKLAFRWTVSTKELKKHESTRDLVAVPGIFVEFEANDRRVVAYPCSDNRVLNLCTFLSTSEIRTETEKDGWQTLANKSFIVEAFSQFAPAVRQTIACAPQMIKTWDMYDMELPSTWTSGHAALIGDSAHPFQPYMGQGGAMGIEDAIAIAMLLPLGTQTHDIPARLALYKSVRRPRIEKLLHFTQLNARDEGRITPVEMVKFMSVCVSNNEIEESTKLLESL